jgi:hypothetical protein
MKPTAQGGNPKLQNSKCQKRLKLLFSNANRSIAASAIGICDFFGV